MKAHVHSSEENIQQPPENLSPYELLSYYANTTALEVAFPESGRSVLPHYLLFIAAGEGFLIDVDDVSSVIRDKPVIKPLPFSAPWFNGLSSVRNEIVSVISFSVLYSNKPDSGKQREKHYILLRGAMEGFMLEVDKLIGIRSLHVQETDSGESFIDGYVVADDLRWQHINTDELLATKLN